MRSTPAPVTPHLQKFGMTSSYTEKTMSFLSKVFKSVNEGHCIQWATGLLSHG